MAEAIRVRIHGSDFILETEKIKEIADGSRNMLAITDELKRYSLIVSSDATGKMIQFKPLIRNLKEYKISSDELFQNQSGFFEIPEHHGQISQASNGMVNRTCPFVVVETEQLQSVRLAAPPFIPPRKFLSDEIRKNLTAQFGEGKSDDQLQFFQHFSKQQALLTLNKKILLEQELGITDEDHSRSPELLEDLINTKRHLRKIIGEYDIDNLNPLEFEDLYGYYQELQDSMKSDDWIQYKLKKFMKRRKELGSKKKFRELDIFLLNNCFH